MDIALIIGVVLGLAAMIGSIAYALFVEGSAGGFGNFLSAPSFGIVFGGMIASIFVAFPMPHVVALGKAIGAVLKPADDKMGGLVDEAVEVADVGRKGAADLEKAVDGINNYFFKHLFFLKMNLKYFKKFYNYLISKFFLMLLKKNNLQ